jgi:hypothetical protein
MSAFGGIVTVILKRDLAGTKRSSSAAASSPGRNRWVAWNRSLSTPRS